MTRKIGHLLNKNISKQSRNKYYYTQEYNSSVKLKTMEHIRVAQDYWTKPSYNLPQHNKIFNFPWNISPK